MLPVTDDSILDLSGETPFAEGDNRLCFVHPTDPALCLKVMRPGRTEALRNQAPWHKRLRRAARFDDNRMEARAYERTLRHCPHPALWDHLPRWHGMIPTSLGPANVTELIRNPDGTIAGTADRLLKSQGLPPALESAFQELVNWLRKTQVPTKNLIPHNLVAQQRDQGYRLFLIDGLGIHGLLPLPYYSRRLRRRHIERRIDRLWLRLEWETSNKAEDWNEYEGRVLGRRPWGT